jgi:hypothetical protein
VKICGTVEGSRGGLWYPTSREKRARCPEFLYATLEKTACAPFSKERRMKFREPMKLHRKSGMWGTRRLVARIEPESVHSNIV